MEPALRKQSLVQRDKTENPERNPHLYGQLHFIIHDVSLVEKQYSFQNIALK